MRAKEPGELVPIALNPLPIETITITLPICRQSSGYKRRHVDLQLKDDRQIDALRMLYDGMAGVQLENGRRVADAPDVFRHILEKVAEQCEVGA